MPTKNIGPYTLSIDNKGAVTLQSAQLREPLLFNPTQAQELAQWLTQQQELLAEPSLASTIVPAPATESSEEIAQRVIIDAITQAREHYPASLELENRDRFIDQITRDPAIKPLVSQGKISRKQIMLWMEQQLEGGTSTLWTQDKKRSR